MTENPEDQPISDDQPRPTARPRTGPSGRPTPRARVAGARRGRDQAETAAPADGTPAADDTLADGQTRPGTEEWQPAPRARRKRPRAAAPTASEPARSRRGIAAAVATLAVLCLVAAAGTGVLIWQRLHPSSVDPTIFSAARSEVQALYAFDYKDANGSIARKLDVLTGSLRDEYKKDLSQGGIIDTYKQVSATTSYTVLDVGLQQVSRDQTTATVVVFGQYVVKSVNTANQKAPAGSECQATPDGGQSCTQTIDLDLVKLSGAWKIKGVTVITSS